jgi:hypothetical protein
MHPYKKELIVVFGVKNLSHPLIEAAYQFVHSSVIPMLAALWKPKSVEDTSATSNVESKYRSPNPISLHVNNNQEDDDDTALFLRAHSRWKNMSLTTASHWM